MRFDPVFGDVECGDIRQRAFQTITDLDKHLTVLREDEQHHTVAALFLADAPCLCHTLGVVRDV